jgi:long-chain acyl-CoA synthetase
MTVRPSGGRSLGERLDTTAQGGDDPTGQVGLASLLAEHPLADDQPLVHTASRSVTAGAVRQQAASQADELRRAGLGAGQAVAVQMRNGPDLLATMFAVWQAGGVYVPVNPRLPQAEVDHILGATGPALFVDGDGRVEPVEGAAPAHAPGTAFVVWTSGTTGRPKPILHTHTAYLELLDRVLAPLRGSQPRDAAKAPSPNLIPVSMALNAGIYNALFGLRAGAPLVIMDQFDAAELAALVRRFGIRSTVLPPAAMAALSDDADITDLQPLRYVRSITAALSPLQARRFHEKFGVVVLNGYGQAEIGEVIGWTAADAREHPEKVGAAGRVHPGVSIKILDARGDAAEPGLVGALWVRPASMAAGYVGGDELEDRLDADGFLDTGDFARQDDDGFVWIEGRASDLINRGGNKVFPEQVEEVLRLSDGIVEAAVVGRPDDRLGQVPVAFLAGPGATDDELVQLCRDNLAPYKVPVAFHWVAALPRSEVGKVRRAELLSQL